MWLVPAQQPSRENEAHDASRVISGRTVWGSRPPAKPRTTKFHGHLRQDTGPATGGSMEPVIVRHPLGSRVPCHRSLTATHPKATTGELSVHVGPGHPPRPLQWPPPPPRSQGRPPMATPLTYLGLSCPTTLASNHHSLPTTFHAGADKKGVLREVSSQVT